MVWGYNPTVDIYEYVLCHVYREVNSIRYLRAVKDEPVSKVTRGVVQKARSSYD